MRVTLRGTARLRALEAAVGRHAASPEASRGLWIITWSGTRDALTAARQEHGHPEALGHGHARVPGDHEPTVDVEERGSHEKRARRGQLEVRHPTARQEILSARGADQGAPARLDPARSLRGADDLGADVRELEPGTEIRPHIDDELETAVTAAEQRQRAEHDGVARPDRS